MTQEKITFEQFLKTVESYHQPFIQDLHDYLIDSGCAVSFEQKKSGLLASYKIGKPKKALLNFVFRKAGMLVRIYGENAGTYLDFLNTLPSGMVESIASSGDCKRLISGGCSPKCSGYDVTVNGERYQKCKYNAFEFLVTDENNPYIKSFIENEIKERAR